METYKLTDLTFTYPGRDKEAISGINLTVEQGEFITVCGKSGCGKTTLLRLLKPQIAPHGNLRGSILFEGLPFKNLDERRQVSSIGFVMQSPENQIVTDKVWHELAFGLESLGFSTPEIRTRVSEISSFFGISSWFHSKTADLSGGQKQILNLASVMVMQPSVLLLDEPTSQLDPIGAGEFINILKKINRETGTTVILTEHRLEEAFPVSDRVIVLDEGRIISDASPKKTGAILKTLKHEMFFAVPAPMRVFSALDDGDNAPVTVREGKLWLENYAQAHTTNKDLISKNTKNTLPKQTAVELRDIWFRYEKTLPDIIKGLSSKISKGEIFAILGGNAAGKTTALSIIGGILSSYRGEVVTSGSISVLPQDPRLLFTKKNLYLDLLDMLKDKKMTKSAKDETIRKVSSLCEIYDLLSVHPYDLSGGEQQRAALAKVLLCESEILLLDEPTKGMDTHFKQVFADILSDLKADGKTVIIVSHDIDFCAEFADRCAMFFDGGIVSVGTPAEFFGGKNFYTTAANKMARNVLPQALLPDDIISAFSGVTEQKTRRTKSVFKTDGYISPQANKSEPPKVPSSFRIAAGFVFLIMLIAVCALQALEILKFDINALQLAAAALFGAAFICFFPKKVYNVEVQKPKSARRLPKRTYIAALLILLAIPFTIYMGIYYFGDRKYYFISILIIIETLIPFCMAFEGRGPRAREIVVISVLCAMGVVGRTAFFMLPQFKPVVALIIISGVCFGGETGFLVGAMTGFVSNFFFGQGSWTPWQMFVFGIIGFVAGISFGKGLLRKTRASLAIFGFFATVILYGGIMNPASVLMFEPNPTREMIYASYLTGIWFDIIHGASTAFFLWFISEPMIEKLERIKLKYGLIEE